MAYPDKNPYAGTAINPPAINPINYPFNHLPAFSPGAVSSVPITRWIKTEDQILPLFEGGLAIQKFKNECTIHIGKETLVFSDEEERDYAFRMIALRINSIIDAT